MNNITVHDLLQHSFVITIDNKRYTKFCQRFTNCKLNNPLPTKYIGFTVQNVFKDSNKMNNGFLNCSFSHAAIVKFAQAMQYEYVCIFEDDAVPNVSTYDKLQNILKNIPDNTDILKFGWNRESDNKLPTIHFNHLFDCRSTYGAHAYVVFKQYFSKYNETFSLYPYSDHEVFNDNTHLILTTKDQLFLQINDFDDKSVHGEKTIAYFEKFLNQKDLTEIREFIENIQ